MFQALYDFFYNLFNNLVFANNRTFASTKVVLGGQSRTFYSYATDGSVASITYGTNGGLELTYSEYFSLLASIISLVLIIVLCCLFVYKIIKLVGNLIR